MLDEWDDDGKARKMLENRRKLRTQQTKTKESAQEARHGCNASAISTGGDRSTSLLIHNSLLHHTVFINVGQMPLNQNGILEELPKIFEKIGTEFPVSIPGISDGIPVPGSNNSLHHLHPHRSGS